MPAAVHTRHVRALVLASASFGLGLAGHLEAGGHSGSAAALLLAGGYCALTGWGYSRRRLSGPGLVAVLLGNQVVMHLVLAAGSAMGMSSVAAAPMDCPHTGQLATGAADVASGSGGMGLIPGGWMALAHLAATVLTAAAILAAQAVCVALVALGHWLDRVVGAARSAPLVLHPATCPVAVAVLVPRGRQVGARPGRGPPLPVAG